MIQSYYVRLLVQNFDACLRFYRDVMKFNIEMGQDGGIYASFHIGPNNEKLSIYKTDLMAQVVHTNHLSNPAGRDRALLSFLVASVNEETERLKALDIPFITEPQDHPEWGIRTAHFRDPDGNLLEIYERL